MYIVHKYLFFFHPPTFVHEHLLRGYLVVLRQENMWMKEKINAYLKKIGLNKTRTNVSLGVKSL